MALLPQNHLVKQSYYFPPYEAVRLWALLIRRTYCMNRNDYAGNFLYHNMLPIATSPNDTSFSCGCTTVMRDSRVKTKNHGRKTDDGAEIRNAIVISLLFSAFFATLCIQHGRAQARSRTGSQCSLSAETAHNTQASAATSSNEPGSEIEMVHLLRRPGGATNNLRVLVVEEERRLEVPQ